MRARASWRRILRPKDAARLVFVDEFGLHRGMRRTHARSARGERARAAAPINTGPNLTLTFGLRTTGPVAPWVHRGAANGPSVETYVRTQLAPTLRPNDLVVFDGLSAHKAPAVRAAIEARGAWLLLLPPYSPDLTPVEKAGFVVKERVRAAAPDSEADVLKAIVKGLARLTPEIATAIITWAGYRLKPG